MKKTIFALIALIAIGTFGCSGPAGSELPDTNVDGGVSFEDGLWDSGSDEQDEIQAVDGEDGESTVEVADDESESAADESDGDSVEECGFSMHSITGLSDQVFDIGEDVGDVTFGVTGGSGNFYWEDITGALPDGLTFDGSGDLGEIGGTVADTAEPGTYDVIVKVTDLDCARSVTADLTITVYEQFVIIDLPEGIDFEGEAGSRESSDEPTVTSEKVTQINVFLTTGKHDHAGTDAIVKINFCSDKHFDNCIGAVTLDVDDRDDNEKGATNKFTIDTHVGKYRTDYFKIWLKRNGTEHPGWLLEGVKIEQIIKTTFSDGTTTSRKELAYHNPCVLKWFIDDGAAIRSGPEDTAICAIVKTGSKDKSGTDDDVNLVFEGIPTDKIVKAGSDISYKDGPMFELDSTELTLNLAWNKWNDHEKGREASYGDYSFDTDFFESTNKNPESVTISKEEDGKYGGWLLGRLRVYIFQPAKAVKYGDNCKPSDSCSAQIEEIIHTIDRSPGELWIEDETDLEFTWTVHKKSTWTDDFDLKDFQDMGGVRVK